MDPHDLTQAFVERCERFAPVPELVSVFRDALAHMGFRYFACCSHVNPKKPPSHAVVLHNYPSSWARAFAERDLHEIDPILLRSERTILPFFWDNPELRASLSRTQKQILHEAADVGIANGYTVPIHLPWDAGALRASCSVVPDSRLIGPHAYRAVQTMSLYFYASVNDRKSSRNPASHLGPILSVRERQCLELAAQGKSDWEISQLLNISENTVHKHVESAKRRLGVATRVQAIVWAAQRREISFGDVIKAGSADLASGSLQALPYMRPARSRSTPRSP